VLRLSDLRSLFSERKLPSSNFYFLISKCVALWLLRGIGAIQGLAKLTAVNLGFRSDGRRHFFRIVVPALQMPRTEFAFLVFFVARTLFRLARLDFRSGCSFFCHGILSTSRGHGKKFSVRCGRSATLRPRRRKIQIAGKRPRPAPAHRH